VIVLIKYVGYYLYRTAWDRERASPRNTLCCFTSSWIRKAWEPLVRTIRFSRSLLYIIHVFKPIFRRDTRKSILLEIFHRVEIFSF